jgi:hypothetical protein
VAGSDAAASDPRTLYGRYNDLCNRHDFAALGGFVADDVRVNEEVVGLSGSAMGLRPSSPRSRLPPGDPPPARRAAARSGTFHRYGYSPRDVPRSRGDRPQDPPREFAFYRFGACKIADVGVTGDDLWTLDQVRA